MCSALSGLPISCATLAASKRQRLHALAFDGLKSLLPRLGGVVQNQRHAGAAGLLRHPAARRRAGETAGADTAPQTRAARRAARRRCRSCEIFFQSTSGRNFAELLPLGARLQADQPRHRLVEINDAPALIHHQHAVLDGVEQGFQKLRSRASRWTTVCKPSASSRPMRPEDLVEKTGFRGAGHSARTSSAALNIPIGRQRGEDQCQRQTRQRIAVLPVDLGHVLAEIHAIPACRPSSPAW